jgi:multidrug efflux pump subunit AcrB
MADSPHPGAAPPERSLTARIVQVFLTSKLSVLFLGASLAAGAVALAITPREEEPQIVVPFADVLVQFPGASAEEVEKLVSTPVESKLWEIDGVEYVYSASRPGEAVVTVRFFVGQDRERSLVKIWNKLMSNPEVMPPGVTSWTVKPIEIDDVPIVLLTLSSGRTGSPELRRLADEMLDKLGRVPNAGKSWVVGGERRGVSVYLDPTRLSAYGRAPLEVARALGAANVNLTVGRIENEGRQVEVEAGPAFRSAEEAGGTVVGQHHGRPVHLREVARIVDGPLEPSAYTRIGFGPQAPSLRRVGQDGPIGDPGLERSAVTIAVAKRKGTNAVRVAEEVVQAAEGLRGSLIPQDVLVSISRDYGETANHKVNELVRHLLIAVATIIVLLAIALGPREAFIVAIAVPMTLAVTLLFDLVFGYTINRVTLFALILSLGLLVDDPIVDVENIYRHFKLRREPPLEATITAVDEVRPPTILATFTVIVSFLPMFFITGMMGPYMAPMAFNVPVAMLLSLLVAFTVTPWASYHLLKHEYATGPETSFDIRSSRIYRLYRTIMEPLLARRGRAALFLGAVVVALVGSGALAVTGAVPLKMLPFDNKNELALVVDMPRGSTLEETDSVVRRLGRYLSTVSEVTDYESYVGLASPIDFNGMVRHYYLRQGGNVADIRINLLPKERRSQQSHEIALRIRAEVERLGKSAGANIKIVEAPPGPPVLSTLVAEVYGPLEARYEELVGVSKGIRTRMEKTAGVVDVDDWSEADHGKVRYRLDREKAALSGISAAEVAETLRLAIGGLSAGLVHVEGERQPLALTILLPRELRSSLLELGALRIRSRSGTLVPLGELGTLESAGGEKTIYHKNLRRLALVTGEMAGRSPVEAILDLKKDLALRPLRAGYTVDFAGEGEWQITLDVFRDLGMAFAAANILIYVLLVAQTGSLGIPLVIMVAIPLTIIGIMPGFWLLNTLFATPVAGYATPIFFTATGMIGMIALAGIVVRNSIILIDFIEHIRRRGDGLTLLEAVIEAGATRFRPILLTAGAAMFGSVVITLDPIFSGLAWSFIFGIFASTAFSLVVVPLIYYLIYRRKEGASGAPRAAAEALVPETHRSKSSG